MNNPNTEDVPELDSEPDSLPTLLAGVVVGFILALGLGYLYSVTRLPDISCLHNKTPDILTVDVHSTDGGLYETKIPSNKGFCWADEIDIKIRPSLD